MQSVERRIAELEARAPVSHRERVLIVGGDGDAEGALNEAKARSIAADGPLGDGEEWFPVFLVPGERAA